VIVTISRRSKLGIAQRVENVDEVRNEKGGLFPIVEENEHLLFPPPLNLDWKPAL